MTYRELFYTATRKYSTGEITLGVYDEMTKPLDREIEQEPCGDCISRQAVLKGIAEWVADGYADNEEDISHISGLVTHLPSVTPKPKTGKWLHRNDDHNDWSECSECGYGDEGEVKFGEETPCCPKCGSRNESEG